MLEVEGDVGQLFLDVADDFSLGGGGEGVPSLSEDLYQVVGEIASGEVETEDGVGKSVPFVDWDGVGHAIARIENNTCTMLRLISFETLIK